MLGKGLSGQRSMPEASRADIKEPRERSGNTEGIASGTSAVGRAGADIKEPRERSGNGQWSMFNGQ
ncbi:MAG: hypothetical protein IKG75_09105 [Bacteroidaceae bacterium]|nr:hypothetical protein [Bacteroidaceae bacterium]